MKSTRRLAGKPKKPVKKRTCVAVAVADAMVEHIEGASLAREAAEQAELLAAETTMPVSSARMIIGSMLIMLSIGAADSIDIGGRRYSKKSVEIAANRVISSSIVDSIARVARKSVKSRKKKRS